MRELNRIPLKALRAVEATARLGSLARAAEELAVTPGAISQQIVTAERLLGFALFDRHSRGMTVAPRAEQVCALLSEGFARLTQAVALADRSDARVLTVSVAPVFAARWLIWRLPEFHEAYPDVKVRLDASTDLLVPGRDDADLCFRVGSGTWPGVAVERIFPQIVFPVCSPAFAERLRSTADLRHVPVIREPRPNFAWADWLGEGDPREDDLSDGPVFSDAALCLDAAISGSGVFLTFETVAADPLAHGRLVEPFARRRMTANAYWLVAPADGRLSRPSRLFRSWLKAQIAAARFGRERSDDGDWGPLPDGTDPATHTPARPGLADPKPR